MDLLAFDGCFSGPVLEDGGGVVGIKPALGVPASDRCYLTITHVFPMAPSPTMTILQPIAFYIDRIGY